MTAHGYPYKKDNPRTVRGAVRRGWHKTEVRAERQAELNLSWLGIVIWATRNSNGYFINNYSTRTFAFELEEDASKFIFQFVL